MINVVLCWHMHQPDYRFDGRYQKPWTLLHAIKDYSDMAAHLERIEGGRAVVNFSPVLIEQLLDYPVRIRALFEHGTSTGDFLADALFDLDRAEPGELLQQLLRVNEDRMKDRFPPYARLFDKARNAIAAGQQLHQGDTGDLLVWYVIAWLGESLRNEHLVLRLEEKAGQFTQGDRRELLVFIAAVIGDILPRYRKLSGRGAAELSVTPYSHPILPLLLDFESARDAMPGAPLPRASYPDGASRCDWHLSEARRVFGEAFNMNPAGCWPSEGSISQATLKVMGHHHFRWTASGSQVLNNSLARFEAPQPPHPHLHVWQTLGGNDPACFFRDDGMSDLIGFQYSGWSAADAVEDFIRHIESRHQECAQAGNPAPVLSIIMDGENAWEYYHENGWQFLHTLYTRLATHPDINLTTFSDVLDGLEPRSLPVVCAGSWVYGNFSTWIGSPAKNRAWELLVEARRVTDKALASQPEPRQQAWASSVLRQLAVCEASDWFWWLREEQQTVDEAAFDSLFRQQLTVLYRLIGRTPPQALSEPVAGPRAGDTGVAGGSSGPSGTMRRSG